jgi:hypothetical protein
MEPIKALLVALKDAVVAWLKQPGVYVALGIGFGAAVLLCSTGNAPL